MVVSVVIGEDTGAKRLSASVPYLCGVFFSWSWGGCDIISLVINLLYDLADAPWCRKWGIMGHSVRVGATRRLPLWVFFTHSQYTGKDVMGNAPFVCSMFFHGFCGFGSAIWLIINLLYGFADAPWCRKWGIMGNWERERGGCDGWQAESEYIVDSVMVL
jgi:hypothetical protein